VHEGLDFHVFGFEFALVLAVPVFEAVQLVCLFEQFGFELLVFVYLLLAHALQQVLLLLLQTKQELVVHDFGNQLIVLLGQRADGGIQELHLVPDPPLVVLQEHVFSQQVDVIEFDEVHFVLTGPRVH